MEKIGNIKREKLVFKSRVIISIIIMLSITLILILRLFNLQVTKHDYYVEEALGNQMQNLPITPIRGNILDRNGKILATNEFSYILTITPEKVTNLNETLIGLEISDLITYEDIKKFNKKLSRFKKFHNIPLKFNLSESSVASFLLENQLPGVEVEPYFHRVYPYGESSAHLIGYVSSMSKTDKSIYDKKNYNGTNFVGKTGIEKQYEKLLHGQSGIKQIERNVAGRIVDTKIITPSIAGQDIYLNIDIDLQLKAESLLGDNRGVIALINVKDGSILSLVSTPSYNPNWFVNGITVERYNELSSNEDLPLFDRSIKGLYPPGSTIKPMVALAGLELNNITIKDSTFCPGYYKLNNYSRKFNDWKRTGHGKVDVIEAIAQSCDVFFYDLAFNMGIDQIHDSLSYFQFGKKTGIDLPGELGGILPSREWKKINKDEPWYRGETLITGIGQGFMTASPLQLALATAAIANKGQLLMPQVMMHSQSKNGDLFEEQNLKSNQIPIKDINNWELIIEAMKQTVYGKFGTAKRLNNKLKYSLAGKTGTAQVFGLDPEEEYIAENIEEKLRDHALFTGFAPIEDPQVAIAIIVENAGSGSSKAAPLARELLDEYFIKNPVELNTLN
ncbi:penicillin-binding protein 2 [Candidatus Pseudothioglobus sp. Uisw_050_01]|uniref:penicillin-binding protein 2 n=1 Tax=Candidatus Pseudothioglobus sp. Uisw_050_01 TaxID=3230997 RepID=UPI003A8C1A6E